jgi:hypothetical protein
VSSQEIARYSAIRNPDKLEVGQMLRIPSGQPGSSGRAETVFAFFARATLKTERR